MRRSVHTECCPDCGKGSEYYELGGGCDRCPVLALQLAAELRSMSLEPNLPGKTAIAMWHYEAAMHGDMTLVLAIDKLDKALVDAWDLLKREEAQS